MKRLAPCVFASLMLTGCAGETFGGLLYHLFLPHSFKVAAEFKLADGPLLILVDDDWDQLTWPPARDLLIDEIGKHLRQAKAVKRVFPSQKVNALRRVDPKFNERSISELGKDLGAKQVLWLQVREFVATTNFDTVSEAARCTLRVKVFDPHSKSKAEMRLWPASREGWYVTAKKSARDLTEYERNEDIARMLITEAAEDIAKLFYDHRKPV
ncbi:MAG: hypothetical protein IID34_02815 [Planctomycetes bacterium]|nr:hypothetical protein [Planctomycetota bacterium]